MMSDSRCKGEKVIAIETIWDKFKYDSQAAHDKGLLLAVDEESGEGVYFNFAGGNAPHALIAGATGSGKSVLMKNMLLGLIGNFTPEEVKIVLVGCRQDEFSEFRDMPGVQCCSDQGEALAALKALAEEKKKRCSIFRECNVVDIAHYRQKKESQAAPMPSIWLFHDELAAWFLDTKYKKEVEALVERLGDRAGAAGIHLVFACQHPDKNICSVALKAHFGNRFVLRLAEKKVSDWILDGQGAEDACSLQHQGHMIAVTDNYKGRCQIPFIADEILNNWLSEAKAK